MTQNDYQTPPKDVGNRIPAPAIGHIPHEAMQPQQSKWKEWLGMVSFMDAPARFVEGLLYKAKHIPETNFEIGKQMSETGNITDAIMRFKMVLWLMPNHVQANYLLGCCYIARGEIEKAKPYVLKAYQLDPADEKIWFTLATIDPYALPSELQPTTMPYSVAMDYFNGVAATYEAMQHDAKYKGHQFADEALWDALDRRRRNYRVLELGCGTGLCGVMLAEHAEDITGVDFCRTMLDMAKTKRRPDGRRVYTDTIYQDVRQFAADVQKAEYDGAVAAHVYNYVGEISQMFDGVFRALKPGGIYVFQVERYMNEGYYGLIPGLGRFGHSHGYIVGHVERTGFQLRANDVVQVYPDYELIQYVLRKPDPEND